jgi:hypothetical protein
MRGRRQRQQQEEQQQARRANATNAHCGRRNSRACGAPPLAHHDAAAALGCMCRRLHCRPHRRPPAACSADAGTQKSRTLSNTADSARGAHNVTTRAPTLPSTPTQHAAPAAQPAA